MGQVTNLPPLPPSRQAQPPQPTRKLSPPGRERRKKGRMGGGGVPNADRARRTETLRQVDTLPSLPPPHQATTEGEAGKTKRWGEARDRVQCVDIDRQLYWRGALPPLSVLWTNGRESRRERGGIYRSPSWPHAVKA